MRDLSNQSQLMEQARAAKVELLIDCVQLDVTDHRTISEVINETMERYGRIDILVNNAGLAIGGFIEEVPIEAWRQQMDINYFGLVAVTKAVLPYMRQQRSGHIFNISSVSGRVGFPGYAPMLPPNLPLRVSVRHSVWKCSPSACKSYLLNPGRIQQVFGKRLRFDTHFSPFTLSGSVGRRAELFQKYSQ